jgi:bifunctional DNA-binding transcriptional regulator/antitoxin component of YhaV-PrlF toxin-antitoxin module
MARSPTERIVQPLAKGQITIPVSMRRALGIDETTPLRIRLEGEDIVISKLQGPDPTVRLYTDEEIEAFLAEDVLTPADAEWVQQMLAGLR